MPYLLTLAWIIVILYATIPIFWLLIHPFADHWRRTRIDSRKLLGGTLLLVILATALLTARWREELLYSTPWSWLAWAVLFVAGAAMYSRIGHFGFDNIIGRTELDPQLQQRLVTTGMHARVRHPIYLAHLLMLLAWTIGSGLMIAYVLLAVAIVSCFFMIRAEDSELEKRFGDEYREYRRRVPAILFGLDTYILCLAICQTVIYGIALLITNQFLIYFDPRIGISFLLESHVSALEWPSGLQWTTVAILFLLATGLQRRWLTVKTYIILELFLSAPSILFFLIAFQQPNYPAHLFSKKDLVIPLIVFSLFTLLPLLIAISQWRDSSSENSSR